MLLFRSLIFISLRLLCIITHEAPQRFEEKNRSRLNVSSPENTFKSCSLTALNTSKIYKRSQLKAFYHLNQDKSNWNCQFRLEFRFFFSLNFLLQSLFIFILIIVSLTFVSIYYASLISHLLNFRTIILTNSNELFKMLNFRKLKSQQNKILARNSSTGFSRCRRSQIRTNVR